MEPLFAVLAQQSAQQNQQPLLESSPLLALLAVVLLIGAIIGIANAQMSAEDRKKLRNSSAHDGILDRLVKRALRGTTSAAVRVVETRVPLPFGPRRVRNPESEELVRRTDMDPTRPDGAEHGSWPLMGRAHEAVHLAVIGEPGAAKGQNIVNHIIKHQLQNSDEHLVVLDVKPELEDIVRAYARDDDRIFRYTAHASKKKSSALNLFSDLDVAGEVAQQLTQPELSKDPYWPRKGGNCIEAIARNRAAKTGGAVSLGDVYDIVADREALTALRDEDPKIDGVADNTKEWGSIRSNALEALYAIGIERARRMYDPQPKTTQPDFGRGPRNIVLVQPPEELADSLTPLVAALIHSLYMKAATAGFAGGPGTKFIVDEAASFMALHRLPRYLEIGRGRRVQLCYVLQSRKQLTDVLEEARADRTLASTELQAIGATTDLGTAEHLESLSGRERVYYRGPRNPGGDRPLSEHIRPVVQAQEITSQGKGEWTVRHHSQIEKYRVLQKHYYGNQDHPQGNRIKIYGIPKR